MPKIILGIFSKDHDHVKIKIFCEFPTVNIFKLHFLISNMHYKNVIWTTLKVISQYLEFFCTLRFQMFSHFSHFQIVASRTNSALS